MSSTLKKVLLVILIVGIVLIISGAILSGLTETLLPFNTKPLYTALFIIGGVGLAADLVTFFVTLDDWDN